MLALAFRRTVTFHLELQFVMQQAHFLARIYRDAIEFEFFFLLEEDNISKLH